MKQQAIRLGLFLAVGITVALVCGSTAATQNNAGFGTVTLQSNTSSYYNTADQLEMLFPHTTDEWNLALASNSGYNSITGNNKIEIATAAAEGGAPRAPSFRGRATETSDPLWLLKVGASTIVPAKTDIGLIVDSDLVPLGTDWEVIVGPFQGGLTTEESSGTLEVLTMALDVRLLPELDVRVSAIVAPAPPAQFSGGMPFMFWKQTGQTFNCASETPIALSSLDRFPTSQIPKALNIRLVANIRNTDTVAHSIHGGILGKIGLQ